MLTIYQYNFFSIKLFWVFKKLFAFTYYCLCMVKNCKLCVVYKYEISIFHQRVVKFCTPLYTRTLARPLLRGGAALTTMRKQKFCITNKNEKNLKIRPHLWSKSIWAPTKQIQLYLVSSKLNHKWRILNFNA